VLQCFLAILLGIANLGSLTRTITVTVHVTSEGKPLEGIPLVVRDGFDDTPGKTDASGTAVIKKEISSRLSWVAVLPRRDKSFHSGENGEAYDSRSNAELSVLRKYDFAWNYRVDLVDNQEAYTVDVSVKPARTVSLRLMSDGRPVYAGLVFNGEGATGGMPDREGRVRIGGVSKTRPVVLYANQQDGVRVPVAASADDVDIGDVVIPVRAKECSVFIKVRNWDRLSKVLMPLNDGLTLVSQDGARFISLATDPTDEEGTASTSVPGVPNQEIPEGTWYAAPGKFVGTPTQCRLVERLAAGESPKDVPRIEARKNLLMTLEFDAKDAEKAIMGK
jgi:hypothetical protein